MQAGAQTGTRSSRLSNNTNPLTRNGIDEINEAIPATAIETEITRMALTKMDLIEQVSTELGFLRNQSAEIVQSVIEIVKSSLASGEDVLVSGFGKFCVKNKRERKGRNPATGEDAILPARRVVTFKCSGKLRDKVNGR
jgi:integration host factor subunit alpha